MGYQGPFVVSGVGPGTYTVLTEDQFSCTGNTTVTVVQPELTIDVDVLSKTYRKFKVRWNFTPGQDGLQKDVQVALYDPFGTEIRVLASSIDTSVGEVSWTPHHVTSGWYTIRIFYFGCPAYFSREFFLHGLGTASYDEVQ